MEIPQKSEKIQNVAKSFPPQRSAKEVIDSSGEKIKAISLSIYASKITKFIRKCGQKKKINNNAILPTNPSSFKGSHFETPNLKYVCQKNRSGLKEGFGICHWKNGNVYKGYYKNDKVNGYGVLNHSGGDSYMGEFHDNKIQGFGLYTHNNGAVAIGYWINETQSGIGIETWTDGSEYKGEYSNNKKDGIGTYLWSDGSKYEGEWKNNNLDGYGNYYFNDGRIYYGEWKNNMMDGIGEFYWKNGKKYIGCYVKDKKEGFGFYVWENPKKIFLGFWKGGKQHGVGKFLDEENSKYGVWKNGKRIKWIEDENEIQNFCSDENKQYLKFFTYTFEQSSKLMDNYTNETAII